jgi:hypothetical protein
MREHSHNASKYDNALLLKELHKLKRNDIETIDAAAGRFRSIDVDTYSRIVWSSSTPVWTASLKLWTNSISGLDQGVLRFQ